MIVTKNVPLQPYHTFACKVNAHYFTKITSTTDVEAVTQWSKINALPVLIIGTGSNLLFTKEVNALVARMEIMGIKKIEETPTYVQLSVGAGENWHHFVSYCVQKSWGGLENLSLIPGTVGASPIQNISAYGVEVQELIRAVTAYDTFNDQWVTLTKQDCAFEYRSSIFKKEKNRYIITAVLFQLQKQPQFRTDYGAIREVLHDKGIKHPNLEAISNAVIQIRTSKLPDLKKLGNAGSFFKNPTISKDQAETLKANFPNIVAYPISDEAYKVSAEWLLLACNWNSRQIGSVGCYEKQALVIVNYGEAAGKEIFDFSEAIIESIKEKFDITLEREVEVI